MLAKSSVFQICLTLCNLAWMRSRCYPKNNDQDKSVVAELESRCFIYAYQLMIYISRGLETADLCKCLAYLMIDLASKSSRPVSERCQALSVSCLIWCNQIWPFFWWKRLQQLQVIKAMVNRLINEFDDHGGETYRNEYTMLSMKL